MKPTRYSSTQRLVRANNSYLKALCNTNLTKLQELYKQQKGLCAICLNQIEQHRSNAPKEKRAYVDHNHKTKKLRGLLCNKCNLGTWTLQRQSINFVACSSVFGRA